MEYDSGDIFLQGRVEVPREIIVDVFRESLTKKNLDKAALRLQSYVLPNEWIMLPGAVQMAAKKIIDERG